MKTFLFLLLCFLTVNLYSQDPKLKAGVVTKITITPEKWSELDADHSQLQKEIEEINDQILKLKEMVSKMQSLDQKMKALLPKIQSWEKQMDAAGKTRKAELLNATKQMQETQMSFNLQYLQLQNQVQNENRKFTMISNIMKTKHDTVKNSISNVR